MAKILITNYTMTMVKELLTQSGMSMTAVVNTMNEAYPECKTTLQNVCNKMSRSTLRLSEAEAMARSIGYTLKFVKIEEREPILPSAYENNIFNTNADKGDEEMVMIPKSVLKGMIGDILKYV